MLKLYRFNWDCGRDGDVNGVFIADDDDVNDNIGKGVYFGEILGKHSEIHGTLDEDDLEVLSDDQDFIDKMIVVFGDGDISGYNPLNYIGE